MESIYSADSLRELAREILDHAGASPTNAAIVADSLVEANLRGHDSHGVLRLTRYVQFIADGRLDPQAEPETTEARGAAVVVDGNHGFGQVASRTAVAELIPRARTHGTASAAVRHANHVGRLGEWVEALADEGLIAFAFCNADPTVAPFGGKERRLGTNPFAWAAPRHGAALVMDWSTATMAEGKVAVARARGETVPEGVLVDADGNASTDPNAFYEGGALLPFGAHKGSGLSVMIQIAGGALGATGVFGGAGAGDNGLVVIALDPTAFTADFEDEAEALCEALASDGVLVPGEIEQRTRAQRVRDGIPLPADTWSELQGGARA
jgi:LDH2 family malate/lactate/ureidoglycolate dehydrogenase